MKKLLLMLFLQFLVPTISFADTGKDAVRALMKLEARTEAGISYRDFAPAIGEAKFEVNLFLQSQEADKNKKLADSISKVMAHYMAANSVWQIRFATGREINCLTAIPSLSEDFFAQYPDTKSNLNMLADGMCRNGDMVSVTGAVKYIFSEASKELKIAMTLLSAESEKEPLKEKAPSKPHTRKSSKTVK